MSKSESVWTKATKEPKLPKEMSQMISNLEQVKALLEKALQRDEANIRTLEMELAKIEAQRRNRRDQ